LGRRIRAWNARQGSIWGEQLTVYVFVGPTLAAQEAQAELDAIYLPPVSQGDVYRVARAGATAIGIIDGYFERIPAVWHKEILWAMSEGIHVFGSASMGALRAAELAAFGMVGIGAIFEAYADGKLEDDDEVAVAHGPPDSHFRAGSEAMVNIRATLAAARAQSVLGEAASAALERVAKDLFYPDRAYSAILRRAADDPSVDAHELRTFEAWLPTGRIDQKRLDALAMLRTMREHVASDPPKKRVRYTFERTVWWEQATITAGDLHLDADTGGEPMLLQGLLEEASLEGDAYSRAYDAAVLRYLAMRYASQAGASPSVDYQQDVADRFRRLHGLLRAEDVERWLASNRLSRERFTELLHERTLLEWTLGELNGDITRRLPDELRLGGRYALLLERARRKRRALMAQGLENPSLEDAGLSRDDLLAWYFDRRGQPAVADLEDHAMRAGFGDSDALVRALVREYCYERCAQQEVANEAPAPAV